MLRGGAAFSGWWFQNGPAISADQRQLDLRSAAIGEQFDPRDEAGVIRAQKECDLGDLFGLRHAAHWDLCARWLQAAGAPPAA